jgi:hypothetical protein
MDKAIEALKLALEALKANYLLVNGTETHGGLEQCLDGYYSSCFDTDPINKQTEEAIAAIKEALAEHAMREVQRLGQEIEQKIGCVNHDCDQCKAQPEQEPVIGKWSLREVYFDEDGEPISHRSPPQRTEQPAQRTWVGLTEQDLDYLCNLAYTGDEEFALAVQAKLMEKNA